MKRKIFTSKWTKFGIVFVTMVFGFLPAGCETAILRIATPFLL